MTIHFDVTAQYGHAVVKKAYYVTSVSMARHLALQDGARIVYRVRKVQQHWLTQSFRGREYGMMLLRAISFQVEAGIPAAQAVQIAIESESDTGKRARLQGAMDALARSASLADSLFATGLYDSIIHSILLSGERIGSAAAIKSAMEYMESRKAGWKSYRLVLWALFWELSTALSVPPMISEIAIPYLKTHLPKAAPAELLEYQRQLDTIAFNNSLWMHFSTGLVGVAALATLSWFVDPRFKDWLTAHLFMRVPVLGDWYANEALSRSFHAFALLLQAGIHMPDAIKTIWLSANNSIAQRFWRESGALLESGMPIGSAFAASGILRKDEVLVLNSSRGNAQLARAFVSMAGEREWRQKILTSRIFRLSVILMLSYIGMTLLIGFKLFALFNSGLELSMDAVSKGI